MAPMTSEPWFSVFGYSFTGAFALWLAHLTGRVDAVVSGDFPIAGDYSPLYPEIQAPVGGGRGGPGRLGRPELTFRQPRRARVLPRAVGTATGLPGQQSAMLEHASFPGHDHEGMQAHINEAVPSVLAWFDGLPRAE
jgi:hypothetical protein